VKIKVKGEGRKCGLRSHIHIHMILNMTTYQVLTEIALLYLKYCVGWELKALFFGTQ